MLPLFKVCWQRLLQCNHDIAQWDHWEIIHRTKQASAMCLQHRSRLSDLEIGKVTRKISHEPPKQTIQEATVGPFSVEQEAQGEPSKEQEMPESAATDSQETPPRTMMARKAK